jgi:dTDP-4-dehydrorhamnose 3,5-epimerase-like enzyme
MNKNKLLNFHQVRGDERGQLVAIEGNVDIPFEIKRIFYIYGTTQGVPRGKHAHYKTKQYLISVSGSCKVTLDNGVEKVTYELDSQNKGLLQNAYVWGAMHDFSDDCVLLVLASEHYDDADYIRDYDQFIKQVVK